MIKKISILLFAVIMLFTTVSPAFAYNAEFNFNVPNPTNGITKEYLIEFTEAFPDSYLKENPEFKDTLIELKKILKTNEKDVKEIEKQVMRTDAY